MTGKRARDQAAITSSFRITAPKVAKSNISDMTELDVIGAEELAAKKLISSGIENSSILNVFREIRTQLLQRSEGKNFILMVSSMINRAGTSLIATNLAAALALDKTKTALLVDCNLQNSSVCELLGVDPDFGLTDYLAGNRLDIDDVIYATGIPRLRFIPIGANLESGVEYFSSPRMKDLLGSLKDRYADRFIIIDVPPVGLTPEARILSEMSDFSVLVVPYGKVTENQVIAAVNAIGKEKIAGLIFNN